MTQPNALAGPAGGFPGGPPLPATVRRAPSLLASGGASAAEPQQGADLWDGLDDAFGSDLPLVRRKELGEALLADPEWVARVVDVVGDAVERRIVRELVRLGRTGAPGLI